MNSAYSCFNGSTHLFAGSHMKTRVDVSVKTYSLKFKRVLSNSKLFSSRPIYMYILCHFFMLHWLVLSSQKSYLVCKLVSSIDLSLSDIVFSSWYLWFSTFWQYFSFLNLALNLSPFCSLLYSFTTLPPYFRVNVSLFVKRPESSTNKVRLHFVFPNVLAETFSFKVIFYELS